MEEKAQIKKRGNFLFRQELRNLTLEPTPFCSMTCNLIIGIIFLSVMNPIFKSANEYVKYRVEYDDCNFNLDKPCIKTIEIPQSFSGPALVFYEIEDFYINHKEFVRSKKYDQLRNYNNNPNSTYYQCEGAQYMYEVKDDGIYKTFTNHTLTNISLAYPCGLFAKYMFNDSFILQDPVGQNVFINDTDIAYKEQREKLFINNPNATYLQYRNISDGKAFKYFFNI